jgi:deazaflavin-dependent oxidoreductase (nitroreductase family)
VAVGIRGLEGDSRTARRGKGRLNSLYSPSIDVAYGRSHHVDPRKPAATVTTYQDPAERSSCLRLFYRNWRPTRLGRLVNRAWAWLSGLGLTPRVLLTLQVKGRHSGRLRTNILVVARQDGQRYLVSMLGEGSDWVRNVRAAGGQAFVKRGRPRPVKLTEVPVSERGPILKIYCQVATSGRHHFPLPHNAPVSAFDAVAERYPVFRIDCR